MNKQNKGVRCRMRSIRDAAKYFRELDPDTELTEYTLRQMIKEGTIPSVKTGAKFLINIDQILAMFGSTEPMEDETK